MQKLISKNPIQRYKQGKQIVKAAGGTAAPTVVGTARRHDYKKGEVIYSVDEKGRPIARYKSGPDTKWYYIAEGSTGYDRYGSQNVFRGGRWVKEIGYTGLLPKAVFVDRNTGHLYQYNDSKFEDIGKTLGYNTLFSRGQFNGEEWIYPDLKNKKPSTVAKKTPVKASTSTSDSNTDSDKSNTNSGKSNVVVSNIKVAAPVNNNHYIATRGDVNRYNNIVSQLGLTDRDAVRKFQIEKLGLTGTAADGIWGRNTQAAYDNYINNKVNTTNAAQIMPSVINFANPSVNIPNNISVESGNAANTKAFTDRLYNNTKIFKNGGLISNNPIKRFKSKFRTEAF